ncbi:hypothetical protein H0H92_003870 [Tricholoma furcatifolium]|nr:hypothetical protein H0H92_003870 [Tricholoma furcatifolium]
MGNDPPGGVHNSTLLRDMHQTNSSIIPSTAQAQGSSRSVDPFIGINLGQSDAHDAALFAHFAAATMSSQGMSRMPYESLLTQGAYPAPNFNDHLYNSEAMGHTQLPPFSSLDFPWNLFPPHHDQSPQPQIDQFRRTMSPGTTPSYHFTVPSSTSLASDPVEDPVASRQSRRALNNIASTSASVSSDPDPAQTDNERTAIAEEKRRRNTAASGKIKKKQRTTNLERSVNDLTGRAEDLEREVADLRRENGWLKEIVMLKGSRLAGQNLASHIMAESAERTGEVHRSSGGASSFRSGDNASASSEDDEDPLEAGDVSKRKGKSRKK